MQMLSSASMRPSGPELIGKVASSTCVFHPLYSVSFSACSRRPACRYRDGGGGSGWRGGGFKTSARNRAKLKSSGRSPSAVLFCPTESKKK